MDVQYVSDSQGKTTSVIIPIEDWNKIKDRYEEVKKVEKSKKKPSDFRGAISSETAEQLREYTKKARAEWDRDIP
ncbi:hypothetical protein [Salmonirosea aquatica]|uniref:Prevent-host-death protein n=1 Tax=Salmonirosea aquatica TaxID=2654236 RepID=A0A7C9FQF5_9BACT|nr:hypothetical protein [Cytophagaceae bacterium SJW1-29]